MHVGVGSHGGNQTGLTQSRERVIYESLEERGVKVRHPHLANDSLEREYRGVADVASGKTDP
jgi:hypothetical protein